MSFSVPYPRKAERLPFRFTLHGICVGCIVGPSTYNIVSWGLSSSARVTFAGHD